MLGIYLRHGDSYIAMTGQAYENESVLQALIAQHPEILAGEDLGRPALMLVKQEAPIRLEQDPGVSLDHLYLDQGGVPTLVEVKRSSDTRIRREVVGQLLDYAANARGSLTVERMQEWLHEAANRSSTTVEALLAEKLGVEDPDAYWSRVGTNLEAEQFRLVFVADQIPPSLRRIIEFLNEHTNIDVLGIEVSQYTDSTRTQQIIVPRFVGETEAARQTKRSRGRSRDIDREELLASFDAGSEDKTAVAALLDWTMEQPDLVLRWTLAANVDVADTGVRPLLRVWPNGRSPAGELEVRLNSLQKFNPRVWDAQGSDQLIRRLEASTTLQFDAGRAEPKAPIAPLADAHKRQAFFEIIAEVVRSLNPPA